MADEEKDYEVIDKRKVRVGKDGKIETAPEAETEAKPEAGPEAPEAEAAEAEEKPGPQLPPVDVYSMLKSFIGILGAHAWQWMGLVVNPVTGKLEKDMSQAKLAIDSIAALIALVEGNLSPDEQRELRGMLSDLQINFVRHGCGPAL